MAEDEKQGWFVQMAADDMAWLDETYRSAQSAIEQLHADAVDLLRRVTEDSERQLRLIDSEQTAIWPA
jgi:hypothetical protein